MPKIRGGDRPARPVETSKAKGKAEVSKAKVETRTSKAKDSAFPRAAWNDNNKLTGLISRTKDRLGINEHPRGRHIKIDKDPIGGRDTRPPIAARYGLIIPTPTEPGGPRPPIAARYGLIMPKPDEPARPPIAARYGLIMPKPDEPAPRPPIAARYGLIMPRPGIWTSPRG